MTGNISVKQLAVCCRDVLHIGNIFQTTFYLERNGTCFYQTTQIGAEIQILQREQMALMLQLSTFCIEKIEFHATELGTLTSIGTTMETMFGSIAKTRITDTQSTMHKDLQLHLRYLLVDSGNLFDRKLACQHSTLESLITEPSHLLRRPIIGLRRSMKHKRKPFNQGKKPHVLHQYGINRDVRQLP